MTPISDSLYCGKGFGYAFYGCSLVDARYGWSLRVETIDILKRVDWALYMSISPGMKLQRQRQKERERKYHDDWFQKYGFKSKVATPQPKPPFYWVNQAITQAQVKGDPKILEKNRLAGKKIGKEVGRGKKIKNFGLQMKLQKIITSFYQIIRKKILWSKKINYLKNNIIKSLDKSKFNQ